MADLDLFCNFKKCRKRLTHYAWVTRCSHAFCDEDGKQEFLKDSDSSNLVHRKCPACGMQLQKPYDIVKVDLDPSEEFKSMVLAGLRPDISADILGRSLTFWNYQIYQQQLYQEASTKQARNSLSEVEKYYENVVHKIQNTLEHKNQELKETQQALEAQTKLNAELKERLTSKTRQAQKTQQLYESLRRNSLSTTMVDNNEDPRRNQYEDDCNPHNDRHHNVHPPGFPFIQPQIIQKTRPTTFPRTTYEHDRCEASQGLQGFNFKPVTPNVSSVHSTGRGSSKRPRVNHSHSRRPHN